MRKFYPLALIVLISFVTGQHCETGEPIVPVVDNELTFAVVDSMEQRWLPWWQEHGYNLHATIDEINRRDVDFIISTGDNVACNPDHPAEAGRCYLELVGAMNHYFDVPVYFVMGNHAVTDTYTREAIEQWEMYVAPMLQEFTHKGTHFVLLSDGAHQFTDLPQEYIDWYCETITPDSLSFRHMVKIGGDIGVRRIPCELNGGVQAVFFGHYGEWQDYVYDGTRYLQTPDAHEGNVRFVTVRDGMIVSTEEVSL